MSEETFGQQAGFWIACIGLAIPTMIMAGFMPDWNVLPAWAWITISSVSCGIGMSISAEPRAAALVGGLIGGACIPIAVYYYVEWRVALTPTFWSIEFVIPGLIGSLPGFGAYALMKKALGLGDEVPFEEPVDVEDLERRMDETEQRL